MECDGRVLNVGSWGTIAVGNRRGPGHVCGGDLRDDGRNGDWLTIG